MWIHKQQGKKADGFTLVEMLVAVGMGAALVVAAAGVFSLATKAVNSSQANTEVNSKLRVLHSWLDRDFARIRLDGPLVIMFDNIDYNTTENARLDRVFFFVSGDIPSLTTSEHVNLALVQYGQDLRRDSLATPSNEDMASLSLARWGRLMVAGAAPPVGYSEYYDPMPDFGQVTVNFADLLAYWYSSATAGNDFVDTFEDRPDVIVSEDFAEMLKHTLSFGITRYGMADGSIMDASATPPAAASQARFGPSDEKPSWIEFEIVLRDSNNRLKQGHTSTYRVHLPSR